MRWFLWIPIWWCLVGCSAPHYYWQAVRGHLSILHRQHSIPTLVQDPSTPPELREKLELVLELRKFARESLALPVDGHYQKYADLGRPYVVWNVHAAPEFSMTARSWWYPAVGRLKYRGFFSETEALRLGAWLSREGADVYVGGVEAYSTLGWFRDPVLSTFIHHSKADLAETLFHELAHQKLFVSGDTDFNEAFATAVSQEAVRRWLRASNLNEDLAQYDSDQRKEREFVGLVQRARARLTDLYAAHPAAAAGKLSAEEVERLRQDKQRILSELRQDHEKLRTEWGGRSPYERWFAKPINNAQLNTVATYFDLVPGFERILRQQGGDLPRMYAEVKRVGKLSKEARRRILLDGAPQPPFPSPSP